MATLEDLDEASLKLILTQPKNALVKQYQRLFEMEGVDLTVAAEALGAIARKAIDRKTGARGLRSIAEAILLDTMFDLPRFALPRRYLCAYLFSCRYQAGDLLSLAKRVRHA